MGGHGHPSAALDPTSEIKTTRADYRRAQGFKSLAVNERLALRAATVIISSVGLVPTNALMVFDRPLPDGRQLLPYRD